MPENQYEESEKCGRCGYEPEEHHDCDGNGAKTCPEFHHYEDNGKILRCSACKRSYKATGKVRGVTATVEGILASVCKHPQLKSGYNFVFCEICQAQWKHDSENDEFNLEDDE